MGLAVFEGELAGDQVHGRAVTAQVYYAVLVREMLGQQLPRWLGAAAAGAGEGVWRPARQQDDVSPDELDRRLAAHAQPACAARDDEEPGVMDAVGSESPGAPRPQLPRHHPGHPVGGQDVGQCLHGISASTDQAATN